MWGHGKSGVQAPRYFPINARNHSGRVLYKLFDGQSFIVTDAAPLMSGRPDEYQPTDPKWLYGNIVRYTWKGVLVCGNEAKDCFDKIEWPEGPKIAYCPVLFMPHPASRSFRNESREAIKVDIASGAPGKRQHYWDKVLGKHSIVFSI